MSDAMSKQGWFCEKCQVGGRVEYRDDAGAFEVVYLISNAHRGLSYVCDRDHGICFVRVPTPRKTRLLRCKGK